jgi:hypothetical protein
VPLNETSRSVPPITGFSVLVADPNVIAVPRGGLQRASGGHLIPDTDRLDELHVQVARPASSAASVSTA